MAAWGAFACLAAFYVLYVTPRRGVLFSDEAWYLYNAVRALHHGEIASYLPQAPAHLFNAFSMIFLGDGYLPQRYVFILANMAAGVALLAGVGGKKALAASLPLGLGCVLVAGLASVVNYQNGPGLFLSLGLGLYFLGDRAAGPVAAWTLSTAAGFFLAASAMANLTVVPGLAVICLGLLWRAWRTGRLFRAAGPLACALFLGAMLGAYAAALGLERLFHVPKGHGFLFGRLGEIALLAVAWPVFWGVFAWAAVIREVDATAILLGLDSGALHLFVGWGTVHGLGLRVDENSREVRLQGFADFIGDGDRRSGDRVDPELVVVVLRQGG